VAAGAGAGWYWFGNPSKPKEINDLVDKLNKPVMEKFLPAKQDDPKHPRPYTLVIDLDGFLVSHHWDRELGRWRVAKRPGAEIFLFYAAQLYEVVVFSSMQQYDGENVVRKLDPFGCISYSLFRFATRHEKGRYIKELSVLNRDPAKTIIIGHDTEGFRGCSENMLATKPWDGSAGDDDLERSVDFLEGLAMSRAQDVRTVVSKFKSDNEFFPSSYDETQSNMFERARKEAEEKRVKRESNWFFKLFNFKASQQPDKDYWTRKKDRMAVRQQEWEHVKAIMQKQLEAELAKEKAYYKEHKMPLWDMFFKGPPPPPNPSADHQ
jgi:import inner membrane translocase subunit TIM50